MTNEELQRIGEYSAKIEGADGSLSVLPLDESLDFEMLTQKQLDEINSEVMPIKKDSRGRGKTRRQSRSRKNIFALKMNPKRLRRRTKATEKLMKERR